MALIPRKHNGYSPDGIRTYYKGGGGGGPSPQEMAEANAAAQRRLQEEERARVTANQNRIDSAFSSFDDNFYNDRHKAYIDYYKPEYDRQQQAAHDQLVSSLAGRGQIGGSQGAVEEQDFQRQADNVWASILKGAQDYANSLRQQVAGSKGSLYGMASTSNTGLLDNMASEAVTAASRAPNFSPVGQLFANLSNTAALGAAAQANQNSVLSSGTNIQGTPQVSAGKPKSYGA